MNKQEKLKIFISYSWDTEEHVNWVHSLVGLLEAEQLEVIIDNKTRFGHNLYWFMENAIRTSDVVLMIFTPEYKRKAENRIGGAGYEFNIITPELIQNIRSNEKYIGVLRQGTRKESVPLNFAANKYCDLTESPRYDSELENLIKQIKNTELKTFDAMAENKPEMQELNKLTALLQKRVKLYFNIIFNLKENIGKTERALAKANVKLKYEKWEQSIEKYNKEFLKYFGPEKFSTIYADEPEDFCSKVFSVRLWTVEAALASFDPDLVRYKKSFNSADRQEILDTVTNIIEGSQQYVKETSKTINLLGAAEAEDLKFDFLDDPLTLMKGVLGLGIRSEILHRSHPSHFPIMTQKSLWAMYFLSNSAQEFITIETKNRQGLVRVSHNWNYDYVRFTLVMVVILKELIKLLAEFECKPRKEYIFGYVNMFLSEINDYHEEDRRAMHTWTGE